MPRTALPELVKARAAPEIRAGSEQVAKAILQCNKIELKHPLMVDWLSDQQQRS